MNIRTEIRNALQNSSSVTLYSAIENKIISQARPPEKVTISSPLETQNNMPRYG